MPSADLGDLVMGYDDDGDGPPLLAIQGLGFARWGWSWQRAELAERFRFIAPDTRGIGGSVDPAGPASVAQLADDYLRFLDVLGLDRVHVMGASGGGFIALEMALRAPERIDRMVAVCTAASGAWDVIGDPTIAIFNALGLGPQPAPDPSLDESERVMRFTRNMFSDAYADAHPDVLDRIITWRAETAQPSAAWYAHFQANLRFDRREHLAGIAAPMLVVHGSEDRVVRPEAGRSLAEAVSGARFEMVAGAGHIVFAEDHVGFNAMVVDHLEAG